MPTQHDADYTQGEDDRHIAIEDAILKLMSEARKQGHRDALAQPTAPGAGSGDRDLFFKLRDLADDIRFGRHEKYVLAASARALAEEVRTKLANRPAQAEAGAAGARTQEAGGFVLVPRCLVQEATRWLEYRALAETNLLRDALSKIAAAPKPEAPAAGRSEGDLFQPKIETCPKCGAQGAAFICDQRGCPVNGGAAYPWTEYPAAAPVTRSPDAGGLPDDLGEDALVKLIAKTWLTEKGTSEQNADELSDPDELPYIAPEDAVACLTIAQAIRERVGRALSASPPAAGPGLDREAVARIIAGAAGKSFDPTLSPIGLRSDPTKSDWLRAADEMIALATRAAGTSGVERVRHVKRGTEYEVLGEAEAQIATPEFIDQNDHGYDLVREGDRLVVYRGADGKLWCRSPDEFRDGRFVTLAEPTTLDPARSGAVARGPLTIAEFEAAVQRDEDAGLHRPTSSDEPDWADELGEEIERHPIGRGAIATRAERMTTEPPALATIQPDPQGGAADGGASHG